MRARRAKAHIQRGEQGFKLVHPAMETGPDDRAHGVKFAQFLRHFMHHVRKDDVMQVLARLEAVALKPFAFVAAVHHEICRLGDEMIHRGAKAELRDLVAVLHPTGVVTDNLGVNRDLR